MTAYSLIVLTWLVFGGIHSIMATSRVKQQLQSSSLFRQRYYRLLYNGLSLLTFLPVLFALHMAPAEFPGAWHGSAWAGNLVSGVGVLLGLFALKSYNLAEFIGWPANQVTKTGNLQQRGLLRYVRHPLYSATILAISGLFIQHPDWRHVLFGLSAFLYIRIGIHFEEKKLVRMFGDAYVQYRERTPMLVPAIKPER
ncbi:methyltransferase family protein [Spirosoma luteum]|uniref:methyltransferase family protein n=1 Tax=Spirosoma luteum TaxID=431553 RepID=UPI00037832A6|nr:isoprenylcysteine carboxylmethyltransferase family protein [Spirosoma luteum]